MTAAVNVASLGTAMSADSSGNVGIGTASPAAKLVSAGSSATNFKALILRNGDGTTNSSASIDFEASTGTQGDEGSMAGRIAGIRTGSGTSGALAFSTTNAGVLGERARILSSGDFVVGKTNNTFGTAGATIQSDGAVLLTKTIADSGGAVLYLNRLNVNGAALIFYKASSEVGTITVTASATAYNTSSDYRLKNTIAPMTGALAKVAQLKPVTYKWNADNADGQGFIAHELAEVVPDCVSGTKDAVENYTDEDGNEQTRPKYQGIDTSFLVATLTAAIQELKAIVDAQAARITALEAP
jgi:hypothetical protein